MTILKTEKRKLTLAKWIESYGHYNVLRDLEITEGALRHWKRGTSLPCDRIKKKIMKLSKGALTPTDMVLGFRFKK